MRLIKFSLAEPKRNRNIDDIIDWGQCSLTMNGYHLIGDIVTVLPHGLIWREQMLVSLNDVIYQVECDITSRNSFQFKAELRHRILIKTTERASNGTTTITLTEPSSYHTRQKFNIYDTDGNIVYTDCSFVEREDGSLIYGLINIPEQYYNNKIESEVQGSIYISDDVAFSWEEGEIFSGTTSFTVMHQHITLKFGLDCQQERNLYQDDIYTKQISDEIKSAVVGLPADMEKQIFEPVSDNATVKEIDFKLHFRKRDSNNNWKIVTTGSSKADWWNSTGEEADLLTDLGFNEDEDVAYQRKRLKKSFIRLSFYDSKDRFSQNLLAYTTIFYDTNTAYSTWSKNRYRSEKKAIDATFVVTDRYNYLASSEGFYLYLYPDQLLKTSGDTIYMKAEFNNAKYGKTVNLFVPKDDNGNAILIENDDFRDSYLSNNGEEYYTDMNQLYNDMYSEVKLNYDDITGKYTYSFPWSGDVDENGKLTIHLIEPKGN